MAKLPNNRKELMTVVGLCAGVWTPAISRQLETSRRVRLLSKEPFRNTDSPALPKDARRRITEEVLQSMFRVKDGHYGVLSFAVADPCVQVLNIGMYLDVQWESVVSTWNHPALGGQTAGSLGELQILPPVHPSWIQLERGTIDATYFQLEQGERDPIRNAYVGYRFTLRLPGGVKAPSAKK